MQAATPFRFRRELPPGALGVAMNLPTLLTLGLVLEGVFYMHAPWDREPQHVLAGVEWRRDPPAERKPGRR